MEIKDKLVIVTGASSGIGQAIAKAMSRAGAARVILLARNEERLKAVAAEIDPTGHKVAYFVTDLSSHLSVTEVSDKIKSLFGPPDILINNAGEGVWKYLDETSPEEIQHMMAVPYFAAAWLIREFLPEMRARNIGHIVNISSVASRFVWPGATAYTAARWAVRGLTEALRADLYHTDIHVTLYESGEIESPYWQHNPGSRERIPKIGKWMIPVLRQEYVAEAIVAGIRHNKKLIVIPFMMKLIYLQHFLFPMIVQWLMTVTGHRRA